MRPNAIIFIVHRLNSALSSHPFALINQQVKMISRESEQRDTASTKTKTGTMPPTGRNTAPRTRERAGELDPNDVTSVELRAVRIRELELKRARGQISCAECRRCVLQPLYEHSPFSERRI